jgi:hypothetical protein
MKKLATVLVLTLAINFLAVAGGVGWLWNSKHLDRTKVDAIKQILFPPPATQPATQPATVADATTQPTLRLEELLAKESGHTATEQVEYIQRTFDTQMAQLDRREREIDDLKRQTDLAQQQLTRDRAAMQTEQQTLDAAKQQQAALASDKGFQDSLLLYNTMPSKQVKSIFMGLDDTTVMNYLRAMQPRTASKIIKEFKTQDETDRIQRILERMRQSAPTTAPAAPGPTAAASP